MQHPRQDQVSAEAGFPGDFFYRRQVESVEFDPFVARVFSSVIAITDPSFLLLLLGQRE